jgi:hypothetical protein
MSIEITDSVNYYKWIPSSSGDLSLGYQLGGNDNLQPIATIGKNGTLTASSLQKTANATDTDAYVFAMVDQNGTLQRGYAVLNSINTNFSSIQNQVNLLSQASTGLTNMINTVTAQASQATSVVNSLASLNLDGRVSTLSSRSDLQQTDIDTLKSQNLNTRVSVTENNLGTLNSTVSTLNGQNLNTRLTSTEGQLSLTRTDVNTLKSQNLNSRISVVENQNLDARLASLTSTLGAISTADANLINQYNQLYAAVQALQLQVTNISGGSGTGITSNSNLFNMIVIQGVIVIALVLFLVLKK